MVLSAWDRVTHVMGAVQEMPADMLDVGCKREG
jgi:hypothetical protein